MNKVLVVVFLLVGFVVGAVLGSLLPVGGNLGKGGASERVDILENKVYSGGFVEGELVSVDGNIFTLRNEGDELRISSAEGVTISSETPTGAASPLVFTLADVPLGTVLRGSVTFSTDAKTGEVIVVGRAFTRAE